MSTQDKIRELREEFERQVREVADAAGLQKLQDRFLGRKSGEVTGLMKTLGGLAAEARKQVGAELNSLKGEIEAKLEEARASYERALVLARQEPERRFLERRLAELG